MKKSQLLFKRLTNLAKPIMALAVFVVCSTMNSVFAQNWDQINKIVASDRAFGDNFGFSVAISGDYAIVGALFEKNDVAGINSLNGAGSAYIFRNNAGTWSEVQKIVASDRGAGDGFGVSVAISGDYAIVGAWGEDNDVTGGGFLSGAGAAYIFRNNAGTWSEVQKIVASDRGANDRFGVSVAISGDYAIIGADFESENITGGITLTNSGSAYIFKNNTGTWTEVQKIVASDRGAGDNFGVSVAISGDNAIVGATFESEDITGGNTLNNAGSAYVFKNNTGTWSEVNKIVASDRETNDRFGSSVSISGDYAIVGASLEDHDTTGGNFLSAAGSAYIFKNNSGIWSEVQKIVASDRGTANRFGGRVAISGDYLIVGSTHDGEDTTGGSFLEWAGSAHIFKNNAGNWSEVQKIVASDRGAENYFGHSIAISGDYAIVGTWAVDTDSAGGNPLSGAGAAYIFKKGSGLGIVESSFGNGLLIYPNPTYGNLTIVFENEFSNVQLTVRNVIGQTVVHKKYSSGNQINLTLDGAAGVYFIEIMDGDKQAILKIIKD